MYYHHKYNLALSEYELAMHKLLDNNPCRETEQHRKAAKRAEKVMWETLHKLNYHYAKYML